MSRSKGLFLSAFCLAVARPAAAAGDSGGLELTRIPVSVRQQGTGGAYGTYDAFTPFSNPALLANQPSSWEAEFTGQYLFGGSQALTALAGSWAGADPNRGAWAGAAMLSVAGVFAFPYRNLQGEPGADIGYRGLRLGAAGAYQRGILAAGVGVESASESFNDANRFNDGESISMAGLLLHGGLLVKLGPLDLGGAYHAILEDASPGGSVDVGAAWRFDGWFKGRISAETRIPMTGDAALADLNSGSTTAGLTWNAFRACDVRLGVLFPGARSMVNSSSTAGHAGFTVRFGAWSLDYALAAADNGMGLTHAFGIGRAFGASRGEPTPFSLAALFPKKEAVPGFQLTAKDRTLAVANFEAQNVSAGDAAVISDLLRSALVQDAAFNIVEKANMDKILAEQAFQQSGCTTQECAVKLGKVLNVKYLVVGSFGKALDQYLMAMRVVEVESARIVYSDEAQGRNLDDLRASIKVMAHRLSVAVSK